MTTEISALDFKSATLYAIRVVLQHADTQSLITALKKRMADAGAFFENEPVVIDAGAVYEVVDWVPLLKAFADHRLPVIGVVAQGENLAAAKACGLTAVDLSTSPARNASETKTAASVAEPVTANVPAPAAADGVNVAGGAKATDAPAGQADGANTSTTTALGSVLADAADTAASATTSGVTLAAGMASNTDSPTAAPTMVVRGPLRSGQRVYARQSDLIVMGVVSRGAEVIADGNIHVYGPLRGKAMAGARGDTAARIFTTALDAELVAVAGIYRVIDSKLPAELHQRPAVIQLQKDALHLTPLEK
jgi:septum site-determining protein MinC